MVTSIKGNDTSTFGGAIDTTKVITDAPAFSAYVGSNQSINAATPTKCIFNTEVFDTNGCFDSTTNYRFTPTVAGYYQINAQVYWQNTLADQKQTWIGLWKNGSAYKYGAVQNASGNDNLSPNISQTVYLNGSTDYVEIYVRQGDTTAKNIYGSQYFSWFTGHLVRAV